MIGVTARTAGIGDGPVDRGPVRLLTGTGGGLLGWSVGMITGGLPDYRRRRTAWFSTLALGGAALVGGTVVTSIGAHRFNEFRGEPDDRRRGRSRREPRSSASARGC